ncbi:Na+/H+ antiporter [Legionella dresdenensis]|uniref:Na+/H+ antiporter n=1 Tax=Legionella dresdenensis TaxID=450200 RepID=A0ABV8CGY2_9GAMM
MENVLICLILLLILVVAGILSRAAPSFPAPLIQIILGAATATFFPTFHVGFNPEVFMLLFIPPLLFSDSWRFPKREFLINSRAIIMLSIGLVLFTVAGMGYFIHWLVPTIPLAASFALAAALSPTDAVALKSMTAKSGIPDRIKHILQGEALLNDASGLVSFKFAIIALLTGFFSLTDAAVSLVIIGAGGLITGMVLTYLFMAVLGRLNHTRDDETTIDNLLLLLLPYAAFLAAERLGFSGILAAVSAGFTVDKAGFLDKTMANMRIEGRFVWGLLEVTLNGIVFILLGLYLPNSLVLIEQTGTTFAECAVIICIITLMLIGFRFLWIYLTLPFEALIARRMHTSWQFPNLKIVTAIAFGGVRGAIALAAILSLPAFMPDGAFLPVRDLLIAIVVGVVLCSLVLSTAVLPLILPGLKNLISHSPEEEENDARIYAAQAAIRAIQAKTEALMNGLSDSETKLCEEISHSLVATLNQFIEASSSGNDSARKTSIKALELEETLRLAGLDGARKELRALRRRGEINNTTLVSVMHRLDLRQISLLNERKKSIESI